MQNGPNACARTDTRKIWSVEQCGNDDNDNNANEMKVEIKEEREMYGKWK